MAIAISVRKNFAIAENAMRTFWLLTRPSFKRVSRESRLPFHARLSQLLCGDVARSDQLAPAPCQTAHPRNGPARRERHPRRFSEPPALRLQGRRRWDAAGEPDRRADRRKNESSSVWGEAGMGRVRVSVSRQIEPWREGHLSPDSG
jgi:hypothetical protein